MVVGDQRDEEVKEICGDNSGSNVVFEKRPTFGMGGYDPRPSSEFLNEKLTSFCKSNRSFA